MIDSNVVNVALPVIMSDFHSSLSDVQWILSGYLLALAAILVSSAYFSKRFGAGRVYFLSLIGFTGASALCALAPSLGFLIGARVLQGAVGALLVPLAMDMLLGREGAARSISPVFGIVLFLAPALGPTVGGFLIAIAGWPAIFLINVPIGIVSAVLVSRSLSVLPVRSNKPPRFDVVGSLVLADGLVLTLYGASEGPLVGWLSSESWPYWTSGPVLLVVYALWAIRRADPAVSLKLLRHRQTALALAVTSVAAVVLFAVLFLIPVFMEEIQGVSAMITGLALLPQGVVTGVGTLLGEKLSRTWKTRPISFVGMSTLTGTTALLLTVDIHTPFWLIATILSGRGLALGLTIQPLLYATIGNLTGGEVPDGNTLFNVLERLGGSVGISLLATFFQLSEQNYVSAVLSQNGISIQGSGSGLTSSVLSSLPASLVSQLAGAAVHGFHDTVLLLTLLSLLGVLMSLGLRGRPVPARSDGWSEKKVREDRVGVL
jgi:EmrB/QacA subfamily drug resistance transporter